MQTTVIVIKGEVDYQELSKIMNKIFSAKTGEEIFKNPDPKDCEKPRHPEDTFLVEVYAINGNVPRTVPAKDGRMTDNKTWLVRMPIIRNTNKAYRQQLACKRVIEKFGKITNMEVAEIDLGFYEPVEIPGCMFFNLTTE
jgi:hypothetical protein